MNVNHINPFLVAVQRVFDTMIDMPFQLGKPKLKKQPIPSYEISGIIGLSGPVKGCVVLSLSETLAIKLGSALLDEELTEVDDNCSDAIGEIANMVTGNAKTDFPEDNVTISTPSVVVGKHRVRYPSGVPIISIPCQVGNAELVIDVGIEA